ncbi:MAG: glycosyltransferase family 4 protein [Proteobacteria bacterium]|nr:glycosyltransferase family 4 protein [Pseudomonadota bacterium]
MRIAFYAPLKSPTHSVPSGDRRVARLLVEALERAGHQVELVSALRTYEPDGDPARQAVLRDQGTGLAQELVARWSGSGSGLRPDVWFTYHVYYKAPDWIGPRVSAALGIPYVIAEASYAPKRAEGAWAMGHTAAGEAIQSAALVLCPTQDDIACIAPLVSSREKIILLPPFLDPAPYQAAARLREAHRARLSAQHHIDGSVPWIVVAAMMRPGDKLASYRMLAEVLRRIADLRWQLVVAGDGTVRDEVESALERAAPGRARFLGECAAEDLAAVYAACDLCLWPAVNEAYGMAMLEAQAAGNPVVSRAVRGVPDVVRDGETGLLAPGGNEGALAGFTRDLLADAPRRAEMGRAAARFVAGERSIDAAAARLGRVLDGIAGVGTRPAAQRP